MKGYRKLRVKKDTIKEGDCVLELDGNLYRVNQARIGEKVLAKVFYRPIKPKAKKKQPQYIYLKKGDLIQEGDEIQMWGNEWQIVQNGIIGHKVDHAKFRRKVTHQQLKETPSSLKSELKHDLLNILNTSNPDNNCYVSFCKRVAKEALEKLERI